MTGASRRRHASGPREYEIAPLREAFLARSLSPADVARELGWVTPKGAADGPRVRRALGLKPYSPGHGRPPIVREFCSYETAANLARAIGVDPFEVGL